MLKKIVALNYLSKIPLNLAFSVLFLTVSFLLFNLENKRIDKRVLGLQTQIKTDHETAHKWEQILIERPDYRDGWIQLAAIYNQLGNKDKAKEALKNAKNIDPNNQLIAAFEKFLEN